MYRCGHRHRLVHRLTCRGRESIAFTSWSKHPILAQIPMTFAFLSLPCMIITITYMYTLFFKLTCVALSNLIFRGHFGGMYRKSNQSFLLSITIRRIGKRFTQIMIKIYVVNIKITQI